jgi:hypothetical protein
MTATKADPGSTNAAPEEEIAPRPDRRLRAGRRAGADVEPHAGGRPPAWRRRVRRRSSVKRHAALATGALLALAIAAPFANATTASAAAYVTRVDATPPGQGALAVGPTLIDTTFNGPTSIITTTG